MLTYFRIISIAIIVIINVSLKYYLECLFLIITA